MSVVECRYPQLFKTSPFSSQNTLNNSQNANTPPFTIFNFPKPHLFNQRNKINQTIFILNCFWWMLRGPRCWMCFVLSDLTNDRCVITSHSCVTVREEGVITFNCLMIIFRGHGHCHLKWPLIGQMLQCRLWWVKKEWEGKLKQNNKIPPIRLRLACVLLGPDVRMLLVACHNTSKCNKTKEMNDVSLRNWSWI